MTELERPIKAVLDTGHTARDVERLWGGVQARSAARLVRRRAWLAASLAATVVMLAVAITAVLRTRGRSGPLALAQGGLPSSLSAEPGLVAKNLALDDGSHIGLEPGSLIDVVGNDGTLFYAVLRSGKAVFDIRPHGPRHWTVECGLATVEVVGTRFSCEQRRDELVVTVERGMVLVHGDSVPNRMQRLPAGQRIVVRRLAASPSDVQAGTAIANAEVGTSSPAHAPPAGVAEAASGGTAARPHSADAIDDWLRRADAARRAGNDRLATQMLERVIAVPDDERAPIAAFTLARLEIARTPARAAHHLSLALANGLPRGLEEDARVRLVEAHARAANPQAAAQAAAEYDRRFPAGARRPEVRRWAYGE